jgi:hypothetical protein
MVKMYSPLNLKKMKNRKSLGVLVILLGLMLLGNQSCKKYADNEGISLQTRTERVANDWKVENYKVNGVDFTSLFAGYTETFTTGKAYSYQWGIIEGDGTWAFQNSDEEVRITGGTNQTSRTLFITRLEEKQFWYYYMDGNDKKEFHMIQQ